MTSLRKMEESFVGEERFDNTKQFVMKTIIKNDRLNAYEKYIRYAIENGYSVCSMIEFYKERQTGKHFVLRHDVDHRCSATKKMFLLEKALGVHSTYYFRKSTIDVELMNQMIDSGFEVGFHYETLSDYANDRDLSNITQADIRKCRDILKAEIKQFNSLIKKPISSIVSHGAPKNDEVGASNNVILENQKYDDFGIEFEGYDKDLYANYVDVHIMDGNIRRNYGFSYVDTPMDAVARDERNIVLLAHPNHWYFDFYHRIWNLIAFFVGRCSYGSNKTFKRILDRGGLGD